jgi:hypothetical protein
MTSFHQYKKVSWSSGTKGKLKKIIRELFVCGLTFIQERKMGV